MQNPSFERLTKFLEFDTKKLMEKAGRKVNGLNLYKR